MEQKKEMLQHQRSIARRHDIVSMHSQRLLRKQFYVPLRLCSILLTSVVFASAFLLLFFRFPLQPFLLHPDRILGFLL